MLSTFLVKKILSTHLFSHVHQAQISTSELVEFLDTHGSFSKANESTLSVHHEAVYEIANGKKLYGRGNSENVKKLRTFVRYTYLPFPCHTQFVESGVKEADIVSETGREE